MERKPVPTLFPQASWTGAVTHPWSVTRLGSHCPTRVGSREPGRVPHIEPFLNVYCLLCSGLDQTPQWDPGLQGLGNKYY